MGIPLPFGLSVALLSLCLCLPAVTAHAAETAMPPLAGGPIHQLRIYEIFDKDRFHARFRDHAARIMKRHGFQIVAMWETRYENRTEFAYLLQWPDETTMKDRWSQFMADEEWARIKRETRGPEPMMGQIQDRVLYPVDYAPARSLLD